MLMYPLQISSSTYCDSNAECFSSCCSKLYRVCIPDDGTCITSMPGWAIFLIIFFCTLCMIIVGLTVCACLSVKRQNRRMIMRQRELEKRDDGRQYGDIGGFIMVPNANRNQYQYQYPLVYVFPRVGKKHEECKEEEIPE